MNLNYSMVNKIGFLVISIFLTFGCSCLKRKHKPDPTPGIVTDEIIVKKVKYCEYGRLYGDESQWNIATCDSLLFASLWGTACGEIPIENFMDENGKWYRTTTKDCFPGPGAYGGSATSISKDMFRGLFFYLHQYRNIDLINKTINYGKVHSWIMGDGKDEIEIAGRCLMTPSMINELYDLQTKVEAFPLFAESSDGDQIGIMTGYQGHLQVLGVLMRGRLYDGINDIEKEILKSQASRQPDNVLFQFAYKLYEPRHDISRAMAILEDEARFPSDRLPSTTEYCTDYLFQHDKKESDWLPCARDQPEVHSGTDYVFAVSVLDGSI